MIHIYLCDDNDILLQRYKNQITQLAHTHGIEHMVSTYSSGEQLLFHLKDNPNKADIIYLDVVMGELNGIETAKQLRALDCQSEIIFLTSSEEYVFSSFDVNPLYYVLKDSSNEQQKFEEVFLHAAELTITKRNDVFICENDSVKKQIPLHQISYFNRNDGLATVHFSTNKSFEFYISMETLLEQLSSKHFILCHNDYLVNIKFIDEIDVHDVLLISGDRIPVGRAYAKELKLAFSKSLCEMF